MNTTALSSTPGSTPDPTPERALLPFMGSPVTLEDWNLCRLLTTEQLMDRGFGHFKDNLVLASGAWHAKLPVGLELESISGKKAVVGTDEIDDDTRFGVLAYGIRAAKEDTP
jgi:hypothetical protein